MARASPSYILLSSRVLFDVKDLSHLFTKLTYHPSPSQTSRTLVGAAHESFQTYSQAHADVLWLAFNSQPVGRLATSGH